MLFLRILGLVRGGRANRVYKSRLHHERMSERTTGIRHPHRIEGGVSNPIERQFNASKQHTRHVTSYPEAYMNLLKNYPYEQDELYQWWLAKQRERRSIGEDIAQTMQRPWVVGTWHDDPTEKNPLVTTPLPAIRLLRAMKPQKGR